MASQRLTDSSESQLDGSKRILLTKYYLGEKIDFGGFSLPSNSNNYGDFDRDKTIDVRMYLKFRYHPISSCDQKGKQPSKHKFSTINLSGQPWCIFNKITFLEMIF